MSVMSDNWIAKQSNLPTHQEVDRNGMRRDGLIIPPYSTKQLDLIQRGTESVGGELILGLPYAVPVTENQIKDYVPMIRNFVGEPTRYVNIETGEPYVAKEGDEPIETNPAFRKVISFGVTSYGYDVRMQADPANLRIFTNVHVTEINPKKITENNFATPVVRVDEEGAQYVLIPPHSYLQGPTVEYFCIPDDILVIVLGKSTYARSAVLLNTTPIEPGFEGEVVLEAANLTSSPVRFYLNEGAAQFVFIKGNERCLKTYRDKAGKYQGQTGITFAKV